MGQGKGQTERKADGRDVAIHDRYLLGEVEVAALCGVSRHTVRRWKAAGLLQCVELPFGMRRNLYRKSDVDGFLAKLGAASGHGG